jgi:hypothetical protein
MSAAIDTAWAERCEEALLLLRSPANCANGESMAVQASETEAYLTIADVAERLKVNDETVRRLFVSEPGVVIIAFPRKGRRTYRTLRIPEPVFRRVVTRLTRST